MCCERGTECKLLLRVAIRTCHKIKYTSKCYWRMARRTFTFALISKIVFYTNLWPPLSHLVLADRHNVPPVAHSCEVCSQTCAFIQNSHVFIKYIVAIKIFFPTAEHNAHPENTNNGFELPLVLRTHERTNHKYVILNWGGIFGFWKCFREPEELFCHRDEHLRFLTKCSVYF